MRKTKIICTLGPACDDLNVLSSLMDAGMDVARLNFSHGDYDYHQKKIDSIKKLRKSKKCPVAILLDTKGPEIRVRTFENGFVMLKAGQKFVLTSKDIVGNDEMVSVNYPKLPQELYKGCRILIDDGLIELLAEDFTDTDVICQVVSGGRLSNNKSINLPGIHIHMPYISERDKEDIKFGIKNDVDYIAASFVRNAKDVLELRNILEKNGGSDIHVIAKIENREGVDNIDEILSVSDGIMVARGDMGVEIPFEELPAIQKSLIEKAYSAGKKVITATQMLESMISHPRPTRAEITDVANAIYDGTSAIMLSGETAAGKYPVESVKTMSKIAEKTECEIDYKKEFLKSNYTMTNPNVTDAISHATCMTAHDLGASAIITVTKSGSTARMISKYRPACPIIGCTTSDKVYYQLNMSWGVTPVKTKEMNTTDDLIEHSVEMAVKEGYVKDGDLAVITAGVPLGISGTTNLLKVHLVGNVLVTGSGSYSTNTSSCGKLCVCKDEEEALNNFEKGDILVISETTNALMPILKKASGIITELGGGNSHAEIVGLTLDIPVISNATGATRILKSGTVVTMDAQRGLVYSGENK